MPATASAKIDFRLVPDQDPDEILVLLRRHLDQQGFSDVPAVGMGVGNAESNNHAPDENIFVSDYVDGIKHAAWVMHRFAQT